MDRDLFKNKLTFYDDDFFKLMFENANEASILVLTTSGTILDCNNSFLINFDYNREDLVGKSFSILFTEDDQKRGLPLLELSNVHVKGSNIDKNYLVHKNGNYVWVHGESILTERDGTEFIVKIIFDINEQKKLEEFLIKANKELQASQELTHKINADLIAANEELFRINTDYQKLLIEKQNQAGFYETMLANTADFIYTFDLEGKFTYANKALLDLFNIQLPDIIGKTFKELNYPPDLVEKHRIQIEKVIETKKAIIDSNFYTSRWGERFYEYIFAPIIQNGIVQGVSGTMRDITHRYLLEKELKNKNEELSKINKDLDAFAYTASHDLKAPINNLEGLLITMVEDLSVDSKQKVGEILELINLSINKFKTTLADLASVGRAQIGGDKVYAINIKELVEDVKISLHEDIEKTKAIFIEDYKVSEIIFSRKLLRSILHNLISNAIKYRSPDRDVNIRISTEKSEGFILLKVSDNGLGIKEEDKEKVFGVYERLHHHVEGSGLGLAIVLRTVENNGGRISIDSQIGKGSTFNIYLKEMKG